MSDADIAHGARANGGLEMMPGNADLVFDCIRVTWVVSPLYQMHQEALLHSPFMLLSYTHLPLVMFGCALAGYDRVHPFLFNGAKAPSPNPSSAHAYKQIVLSSNLLLVLSSSYELQIVTFICKNDSFT